jgi:hypothetical protein
MLKKPPNKKPKDKKPADGKQRNAKPINEKPAKRFGRAVKRVRAGRRHQIGLIIPGETKNMLAERAKKNGRPLSREFLILVERALREEEREKAAMGMTVDIVEAALWRLGYTPLRTMADGKAWKMWAQPGHPGIPRSGFVPWEEGEEPKWEQPV